jgi:hypothetical protein
VHRAKRESFIAADRRHHAAEGALHVDRRAPICLSIPEHLPERRGSQGVDLEAIGAASERCTPICRSLVDTIAGKIPEGIDAFDEVADSGPCRDARKYLSRSLPPPTRTANGTQLQIYDCVTTGQPNQQWTLR